MTRFTFSVERTLAEVAHLRRGGARIRNDVVECPGGKQVVLLDPEANVVELFHPAAR